MGKMIQLTAADGHKLDAYQADPAVGSTTSGKPRGGIVVIQEIFGVNSHIKNVADGYAADGYLAIAPALFDRVQKNVDLGYTPDDIARGREIRGKVTNDMAVKDAQAAINEAAKAGKAGIVGYCWGGRVSWLSAAKVGGLACAISYYGGGIPGLADLQPKCPVLFHWGETDQSLPLDQVKAFAAKHSGETHYFYPAGHGFNCDQRESYDAASAKLARTRSLEFLRKHVG